MVKTCSKCKQTLTIDNFSCTKRAKDGSCKYYNSWCNSCRTVQNRERLGCKEKPKPLLFTDSKECLKCGKIKKLELFYKSKRGRLGRSSYCKQCQPKASKEAGRKYTASYRDRNKFRWRAIHRIHQFNRRSLITATDDKTITDDVLDEIYSKEFCYWCKEFTEESDRTLEHIVELSSGGKHSKDNVTMACRSCNSSRRNKDGTHKR